MLSCLHLCFFFATIYYCCMQGYFLVVSLPSLLQVAEHALTHGKQFLFNISAGYVCQFYKDSVEQLLPYVDVVFGNDQEFEAFSDAFGLKVRPWHDESINWLMDSSDSLLGSIEGLIDWLVDSGVLNLERFFSDERHVWSGSFGPGLAEKEQRTEARGRDHSRRGSGVGVQRGRPSQRVSRRADRRRGHCRYQRCRGRFCRRISLAVHSGSFVGAVHGVWPLHGRGGDPPARCESAGQVVVCLWQRMTRINWLHDKFRSRKFALFWSFNSTSFLLFSVPELGIVVRGWNFTLTGYLVLVAVNFSGVILGALYYYLHLVLVISMHFTIQY